MKERGIHINVLRGSPGFAHACRSAAMTLGMIVCAQAVSISDEPLKSVPASTPASTPVSALKNTSSALASSTAKPRHTALSDLEDIPLIDRQPAALTPAVLKLKTLLPDQKPKAEMISPEQMQVLRYGEHQPVKTTVRINGKMEVQWTLHPFDLVRLAREAATKASALEGIRVDPSKVGAVMIAESAMVARIGWSADGKTPSFGLAQLEERTARALGVKDLNDPRQSALAAARLVAEGQRLAAANRSVDASLITSLSYNTSTATRKMLISHYGSSLRVEHLPPGTQAHVKNMAYGEQRMNLFAKLRDQHEKSVAASIEAAAVAVPTVLTAPTAPTATKTLTAPQESTMSTPRPSTRSLVTSMSSDNANQVRLRSNQLALERAGHVQTVPMTARGLNEMRQAVAANVQRVSNAGNPSSFNRDLQAAPMAVLLSSVGQPLANVVNSFTAKVRETYAAIANDLKAAFNVESNSPAQATAKLLNEQRVAAQTVRQTTATLREMREQREQQERIAAQDHPGYMHEAG